MKYTNAYLVRTESLKDRVGQSEELKFAVVEKQEQKQISPKLNRIPMEFGIQPFNFSFLSL